MMDTLPLFYYPSTWLYVDDDKTLLQSLALALEEHNNVKLFQSPSTCIDYFKNEIPPLSKYSFLKSIKSDESYGVLQHTPVDFDITLLATIAEDVRRHNEITAMVIDYNMPEIDGLTLAKACNHPPIKKILLTGKAQEDQAISAFNANLIHRYIQKSQVNMEETLISYLNDLSFQYFRKITAPLLSYLETENPLPLSDPAFINFFNRYGTENRIKEFYLIDKQGSFLCIDDKGNRTCLAIQSDQGIESWLSTYNSDNELAGNLSYALKERTKIPFFGIGKEAWQVETEKWPYYFHNINVLEGRERYYWATINI